MASVALGLGVPAERDDGAASSPIPANHPPKLENAKAFDNSKLRLHQIQEPADATRLLKMAIDRAEMPVAVVAGAAGVDRRTVNYARKGAFDTKFSVYIRLLAATGARLYIGIPRQKP